MDRELKAAFDALHTAIAGVKESSERRSAISERTYERLFRSEGPLRYPGRSPGAPGGAAAGGKPLDGLHQRMGRKGRLPSPPQIVKSPKSANG